MADDCAVPGSDPRHDSAMASSEYTDVLVIGAGQAGLSAAYHLRRLGLEPDVDFVTVDHSPGPGGAWQFRWPTLTLRLSTGCTTCPGWRSPRPSTTRDTEAVEAATAVPRYYAAYEQRFDLRVRRPTSVQVVCDREPDERLRAETAAWIRSGWIRRCCRRPCRDDRVPGDRQRDRDLGATVRAELPGRGDVRGSATAHPRLPRPAGVRGPPRRGGRGGHLGGADSRRGLPGHDDDMGDPVGAAIPRGPVHAPRRAGAPWRSSRTGCATACRRGRWCR